MKLILKNNLSNVDKIANIIRAINYREEYGIKFTSLNNSEYKNLYYDDNFEIDNYTEINDKCSPKVFEAFLNSNEIIYYDGVLPTNVDVLNKHRKTLKFNKKNFYKFTVGILGSNFDKKNKEIENKCLSKIKFHSDYKTFNCLDNNLKNKNDIEIIETLGSCDLIFAPPCLLAYIVSFSFKTPYINLLRLNNINDDESFNNILNEAKPVHIV
ncbi:MAG: hypothetical protein HC836_12635 [Richelia sp. RM2_1_2]|nr:hypothetical protein [Richelia sp. RM2_1_2]